MITKTIFLCSLGFLGFIVLFQTVRFLSGKIKGKKMNGRFLDFIWAAFTFPMSIAAFVIFILSLSLGHIVPYIAQERDHMLIMEYNDNIILYNQYSETYAEAARQQIEQYQAMQSEMARTATIAQLQFFAEQEDSVGNSLTNEIRRFQELIMEQELAINKAHARVLRRPLNRWFFGITEQHQE